MVSTSPSQIDVLIVGAGPIGLTVALSLLSNGRTVALIDDHEEGQNTSRAAVVYPGTLESLKPLGVSERLAAKGIQTPRFTIRDRDQVLTPVPFGRLPTHFPYALLISQAVTEGVLLERLGQLGGRVTRPRRVVRIAQDDSAVTATLEGGETVCASYLVGADGAHSTVREQTGIRLKGDMSGASYSLADVHLSGGVPDDELVVFFSPAGHMVVLPLPGGIHRIVAHVDDAPERPDASFCQKLLDARGPAAERAVVHDVVWGSRFLTHHAVATSYCLGRVALAGDAAHLNSPLGGQGMNLGIHDGVELGNTLSAILAGGSTNLLESYSARQRPIAEKVISITNWLTRAATLPRLWCGVRNLLVSSLSPIVRERLAWRLSLLRYNGNPETLHAPTESTQ